MGRGRLGVVGGKGDLKRQSAGSFGGVGCGKDVLQIRCLYICRLTHEQVMETCVRMDTCSGK